MGQARATQRRFRRQSYRRFMNWAVLWSFVDEKRPRSRHLAPGREQDRPITKHLIKIDAENVAN